MGEVYRARHPQLGRDVAVKILGPDLIGNRDAMARFEREARTASALNHPHIVHIYDIGDVDTPLGPTRYIAMEYVAGETLRSRLRGGAQWQQLVECLAQVADALAKAHGAGIVHRDLKPDNIMITADGYTKVVDFGLAKLMHESALVTTEDHAEPIHGRSRAGAIVGTASYMSPEQAQGRPADARSDLFSFGCVLYEVLAGRAPFKGASALDILHAVVHDDPPSADALNPASPPELRAIAAHCLAKDPDKRPQTAAEVARDLRAFIRTGGSAATVTIDHRPGGDRFGMPPSLLWLLAAVVMAAVLAGIGWMAYDGTSPNAAAPVQPDDAAKAGRGQRQTIAVSKPVDDRLIAAMFPASRVSVKRVDATHLEVEAPDDRMSNVVSVIRMADALKNHRFFDEPAINGTGPGTGSFFAGPGQSKMRVSLNVREASVRELLQLIAKSVGWPVIFDPSVDGVATLAMDDVPWDLVVRSCLEFQGADLTATRIGDVWLVSSRARAAEIVNGWLSVWIAQARRINATDLSRALAPARSERGLILANPRLNAVVIVDRFDTFRDYARILATIEGVGADTITVPQSTRRYAGRRVSFDIRRANLASVLRTFGEISGLNVVVERLPPRADGSPSTDAFSGSVTEARWDNVFDVVLLASSMEYVMRDKLVHVTPAGRDVTDAMVETMTLTREDPGFFEPFSRYLTPRGALSFERTTRTLVIRDVGHRVRDIRAWVRAVDEHPAHP
jgi:hypothetical protein